MKKMMRNLTGALLVAAASLGTARPQSAAPELRLSDIRIQQPQETIFASAPCRRAREAPQGLIVQKGAIDPKTLVPDLNTLMEQSDEVILAGELDRAYVISPSGESTATYYEVRVIRSWKGPHRAGDTLTYGMPGGSVLCTPPEANYSSFSAMPGGNDWKGDYNGPYAYVLFLRQSKGTETKLVQGLRLAAGEGLQGTFLIRVPAPLPFDTERYCAGVMKGTVKHCDSLLETSQSPVMVRYARDPLAQRYDGMPASDFLQEVRSVAASQGFAEKSSLK